MASSSKDRQPRLRASCDGCFLAKVKCSKARPICSRCLACGIDCRYSPSSRAGKPKSDSSSRNSSPTEASAAPMHDERDFAFPGQGMQGLYGLDSGWLTPPEMAEAMARGHSLSSDLSMYGIDDSGMDIYSQGMPWTPPADIDPAGFAESPMVSPLAASHARSQSYDFGAVSAAPWADTSPTDMYTFCPPTTQMPTPPSMGSSFTPSPAATPRLARPEPTRHKSAPVHTIGGSGGPPCICFTVCLQSLQALHNASSPATPPTFDLVLSLNRKAVEGCAAMLACARCMSRSGTHTAAMLLATVIGKITSFYRNASQSYFEGSYAGHPADESRWLELEILARELRKLEEVYARFREICGDLSEDMEVSRAMIGYLGHNLGSTMEVVSHRRTGMVYA